MSKVNEQVARLAAHWPDKKIPAVSFEAYIETLADVPPLLLEQAVTVIVRTEEWFPTAARIRAVCAELVLALPSEAAALAAVDARLEWARFQEGDPPPLHPLVQEALRAVGGARALGAAENPGAARGQYARAYRALRAAALRDAQVAPALEPGPARAELSP